MHQRQQKKRKEIKKNIHKTRKKKLNHAYIAKAETTQKQGS